MRGSTSITRRRFLETAVASTAAASCVVPSSALGKSGAVAPSERITLGFIGLGQRGYGGVGGDAHGQLLRAFTADPRAQTLAVCDVNAGHRQRAKSLVDNHYGSTGCAAHNDFRDLVTREDIDAVVIATPEHWHAVQVLWACRYGKDVYCEKPLSHTIGEAQAVVAAARRYGRVVQVGTQGRASAGVRFACEVVRSGRIGKVQTVNVNLGIVSRACDLPAQPVPPGLDWDLWLGPAPWRPFHQGLVGNRGWTEFQDYSQGHIAEGAVHSIDIAQRGLGADGSGPVEISPPDPKTHQPLTYRYAGGVVMHQRPSMDRCFEVDFVGTEGRVVVSDGRGSRARFQPEAIGQEPIGDGEVRLEPSDSLKDNFLECIRTRRRPVADVTIGASSVMVCLLGGMAIRLGRPLRWDPVQEEFVGDDGANRLRDCAMREPWRM